MRDFLEEQNHLPRIHAGKRHANRSTLIWLLATLTAALALSVAPVQAQAQTSPAPPGSSSPTMPAAGNPAQAATTSEPAVTHAPLILVVGDSLSAEYGLSRGTGWVAQMQKRLEDGELTASVVNASISGDTTAGGLSRLPAL